MRLKRGKAAVQLSLSVAKLALSHIATCNELIEEEIACKSE
jgi:hypothetical protein